MLKKGMANSKDIFNYPSQCIQAKHFKGSNLRWNFISYYKKLSNISISVYYGLRTLYFRKKKSPTHITEGYRRSDAKNNQLRK